MAMTAHFVKLKVLIAVNRKVALLVSGHVLMDLAYLQATTVTVLLKMAMLDGDLTVVMALMKY
jgi:hypothetical protein